MCVPTPLGAQQYRAGGVQCLVVSVPALFQVVPEHSGVLEQNSNWTLDLLCTLGSIGNVNIV